MITKTNFHFSLEPIIAQVNSMRLDKKTPLNSTKGNLLSGEYTILPEFVGTPLGDVLKSLGNIGEARLLRLKGQEIYSAHCDPDDRYHLSIITTPYSFLVNIEQQTIHHLPADGYIWHMDTSVLHSAVNMGGGERIHLNIRERLPAYTSPGNRIRFNGGNFDWQQRLYILTGYINKMIKQGKITGIEKISDRELLLNADQEVIAYLKSTGEVDGFSVSVT
jgi:Aspartyl/Asparaginyl beta-hydroxylase